MTARLSRSISCLPRENVVAVEQGWQNGVTTESFKRRKAAAIVKPFLTMHTGSDSFTSRDEGGQIQRLLRKK